DDGVGLYFGAGEDCAHEHERSSKTTDNHRCLFCTPFAPSAPVRHTVLLKSAAAFTFDFLKKPAIHPPVSSSSQGRGPVPAGSRPSRLSKQAQKRYAFFVVGSACRSIHLA